MGNEKLNFILAKLLTYIAGIELRLSLKELG
jgi:hypothetical protein